MVPCAWLLLVPISGLGMPTLVAAQEPGGDPSQRPDAVIRGVVRARFEARLQLLADALIEARSEDRVHTARSDSGGRYVLTGLPPGPALLRVTRVGHEPLEVTVRVPTTGVVELDLELTAAPLSLPGVRVEARLARPSVDPEGELLVSVPDPRFELRRLELSPGVVESGMIEAVMGMPGNDPADPSDVLFMRGSTTDMKLVLLDGVPVYAPFHVGGLLRSFEPSMLASANFHVGGAPARYDGGLTHVLDLRTRTARRDRTRASATVDLLSTAVALEQPLGSRAGVLVSARALHGAGTSVLGGGSSPYGYDDVLATFDADLGAGGLVRMTGFRNRESVVLDYADGNGDAGWGNGAITGTWSGRVGTARLQATAGASRYDAELPLQPTPTAEDPEPSAILATADNQRARFVLESAWPDRPMPIRLGLSFEDQTVSYSADRIDGSSRLQRAGDRSVLGAYVDGSRTLVDGVTFRGGLRADVFGGDAPRFAPRASVALEIGPTTLLTLAAGRYHQITRLPLDVGVEPALEQFAEGGISEALPVASADHVVLTLAQRPAESVSLGLDGYFKRFTGVEAGGGALLNSGVDVQVVGSSDRGAAWLGYGLSWFWSDQGGFGTTDDFTGRHLLTVGVSGRVAGPVRVETRFSYGAGLPSTGIPFSGSADQLEADAPAGPGTEGLAGFPSSNGPDFLLDESFLRLDVEVHTLIEQEWGGHAWRLRPFLRLLNALDRRDALFYSYQPWRSDDVTPLAVRPILPVFGISIAY
jgi:hypothetical protein